MKVVYSPKGIVSDISPGRGVSAMERAGFSNIVMDFSVGEEVLYTECGKRGMRFPVAMVPCMSPDGKRVEDETFLAELTMECIQACEKIGCNDLIVPALSMECYQKLAVAARKKNVTLLLKNECRDLNGHLIRGSFCDARETAEILDATRFGFCLDVGVCNLCGQNMYEVIRVLGNRVKAVILRENDGHANGALLPFTSMGEYGSCTDWRSLILGLRDISFDGLVVFDFHDSLKGVPGTLRMKFLELARDTGKYFAWQLGQEQVLKKYKSRVLFGAGNMCRNYMKCYGTQFPPLFTCDNNRALWNTRVEGLMVKSPEELKRLPKDCAIFICNIYYDEIAGQLQEMGLENPIEYFSDEWVPVMAGGNDA